MPTGELSLLASVSSERTYGPLLHLCARQVPGVREDDPERVLLQGASAEPPPPAGPVPPGHDVPLPEGGRRMHLRSLHHRAQNLEGAAGHRWRRIENL